MSEDKIGTLEDEARKRKERLLNLKRKRSNTEESNEKPQSNIALPKPRFRSYKPEDERLQENVLPAAKPGDVEVEIEDQLKASANRVVIDELDIQNLAPRKPDWDLKRDVAKKLEILERRTQRAIAELIRDRLKERQGDLAAVVNATNTTNHQSHDDDDDDREV